MLAEWNSAVNIRYIPIQTLVCQMMRFNRIHYSMCSVCFISKIRIVEKAEEWVPLDEQTCGTSTEEMSNALMAI